MNLRRDSFAPPGRYPLTRFDVERWDPTTRKGRINLEIVARALRVSSRLPRNASTRAADGHESYIVFGLWQTRVGGRELSRGEQDAAKSFERGESTGKVPRMENFKVPCLPERVGNLLINLGIIKPVAFYGFNYTSVNSLDTRLNSLKAALCVRVTRYIPGFFGRSKFTVYPLPLCNYHPSLPKPRLASSLREMQELFQASPTLDISWRRILIYIYTSPRIFIYTFYQIGFRLAVNEISDLSVFRYFLRTDMPASN